MGGLRLVDACYHTIFFPSCFGRNRLMINLLHILCNISLLSYLRINFDMNIHFVRWQIHFSAGLRVATKIWKMWLEVSMLVAMLVAMHAILTNFRIRGEREGVPLTFWSEAQNFLSKLLGVSDIRGSGPRKTCHKKIVYLVEGVNSFIVT